MTRETAIKGLKAFRREFSGYEPNEEMFDMAIKALEQEPTTKNDLGVDCVARQDVERYIEGFINEYTPEEELEFINLELDGLKHIPSVTPQEPRKGHWIDTREISTNRRGQIVHEVICSECSGIAYFRTMGNKYIGANLCPNCGAKMVEPQESEVEDGNDDN